MTRQFSHYRTVEPSQTEFAIELDEAREYLDIPGAYQDDKLCTLILDAQEEFQRLTHRAIVPQTFVYEECSPWNNIELPLPPVTAIVSVKSKDNLEDAWVAVDSADYIVDITRSPAEIVWIDSRPEFVQVTYECGYAAGSAPANFKVTLLQLIAFVFENRGDIEARMPTALKSRLQGQSAGTVLGFWSS